jgi:hypothetical protein
MANSTSRLHDPNKQTKTDMRNARQDTTIDVNAICTFLYGMYYQQSQSLILSLVLTRRTSTFMLKKAKRTGKCTRT